MMSNKASWRTSPNIKSGVPPGVPLHKRQGVCHEDTHDQPFEYDRAGTVLALAIQYIVDDTYARSYVVRGESFHVLESSQVLIPSACLKTTLFTFSEYNRLLFIR